MCLLSMMKAISDEQLKRDPGAKETARTLTGDFDQTGVPSKFDLFGEEFGRQFLAAGILDEGKRQPQFGPTNLVKSVSVTKKREPARQQAKPTTTRAPDKRVSLIGNGNVRAGGRNEGALGRNEGNLGRKTLLGG